MHRQASQHTLVEVGKNTTRAHNITTHLSPLLQEGVQAQHTNDTGAGEPTHRVATGMH